MFSIEIFVPLVFLLFITLLLKGKRTKKVKHEITDFSYQPIEHLNSKAEQNFFKQLLLRLPESMYIAQKVRLGDVCKPKGRELAAFNKISRKHLDFVLVEKESSKVICAIELDDKSHNSDSAKKRDSEKNHALSSAGVLLFRVKCGRYYSKDIERILLQLQSNNLTSLSEFDTCPKCMTSNLERVDMSFPNKGKHFIDCSKCSFRTEPTSSC